MSQLAPPSEPEKMKLQLKKAAQTDLFFFLCDRPQASCRGAVLPPSHAEQTQATPASLLTWNPPRPGHARGICSAHDCKYWRQCSHAQVNALPLMREFIFMISRKTSCISRSCFQNYSYLLLTLKYLTLRYIEHQKDVTNEEIRLFDPFLDALVLFSYNQKKLFVSIFLFKQIQKQMSCAMGIAAPGQSPSCCSPQVPKNVFDSSTQQLLS